VLASGRGSNLEALAKRLPGDVGAVVLVISNVLDAGALHLARDLGARAEHVPWKRGGARHFEETTQRLLEEEGIDLVCLAGFMRLLSADFVQPWEGRMLNIHPSLLPAFPGLDAQGQAVRAGVKESGCTVHFVDAGLDSGPVVLQRRVPVLPGDTAESLATRILPEEHAVYAEAVRLVLEGKVRP
jgi:phosphoribosylglycinamide formyltransferase-1